MRPTISQYVQALAELTREHSPEGSDMVAKNFYGWLKLRGEEKKLPAIVEQLEKDEQEREGKLSVRAVTAYEATQEIKNILKEKTAKLFPGKKIELDYEVDPSVIGGVELSTEETLYDATIRAELEHLKQSLKA